MSRRVRWFSGDDIEGIVAASRVEQLGPLSWQKLMSHFPSFKEVALAKERDLHLAGLTQKQAEALGRREANAVAEMKLLEQHRIEIITIDDDLYPPLLKEISDPPLWLFYRGDMKVTRQPTISIVGTRKPSALAPAALQKILPSQLLKQIVTVSGLAYGIDKMVHRASLAAKSKTAAVLAGGLDKIYPADHSRLAEEIVESGGVIMTEYPPLSRPQTYRFPVRNRIIAGLSQATIIVEAAIKSGTLTTAKSALDYNRDVWAVPGDITKPQSAGPNFLISRGAELLSNSRQIMERYALSAEDLSPLAIDSRSGQILNLLTDSAMDLDRLTEVAKLGVGEVMEIISELELNGLVAQPSPGYFQAVASKGE